MAHHIPQPPSSGIGIFQNLPLVRALGSFLPLVLRCSGTWAYLSCCSHGDSQKGKGLAAPAQVLTSANCWEASLCRLLERLVSDTWVRRCLWTPHPQFCIRKGTRASTQSEKLRDGDHSRASSQSSEGIQRRKSQMATSGRCHIHFYKCSLGRTTDWYGFQSYQEK